jgi:hypothetical protein
MATNMKNGRKATQPREELMYDVSFVPMPTAERELIVLLGLDKELAGEDRVDSDDDDHAEHQQHEHRDIFEEFEVLFTFQFTSTLSVDEWHFGRVKLRVGNTYLYFLDGVSVTGEITVAGVGPASDADTISMYLRIAEHTGETLPEKITISPGFTASKEDFLGRWHSVRHYRTFPEQFAADYAACIYRAA